MMLDEAITSHSLMVTESADAGVFRNPSTPEWELNKWMEGLSKELDTMEVKNVLEKVPQSKFPNASADQETNGGFGGNHQIRHGGFRNRCSHPASLES